MFDRRAQAKYGVPAVVLMENAGRNVAEEALKIVGKRGRVAVICGVGNNGGDGLVAARHLINAGIKVDIYLIGDNAKFKTDPKTNYDILVKMGSKPMSAGKPAPINRGGFQDYDLIIDAIFGIGLNSAVKDPYRSVIEEINRSGITVLSVDVPSGLDADAGKVLGAAVRARRTVTFVAPKTGFYKNQGPEHCGQIVVRDIGIV